MQTTLLGLVQSCACDYVVLPARAGELCLLFDPRRDASGPVLWQLPAGLPGRLGTAAQSPWFERHCRVAGEDLLDV